MQLGADALDLDELKGVLPRRRNHEWVVGGTARRVRARVIRCLDGGSLTLSAWLPLP